MLFSHATCLCLSCVVGIWGRHVSARIEATTFSHHHAQQSGVLALAYATLHVHGTLFQNNTGEAGAAISLWGSQAHIDRSTFARNWATRAGAAIFATANTTLSIQNCDFTANRGPAMVLQGGALALDPSTETIVDNTTFTANMARLGVRLRISSMHVDGIPLASTTRMRVIMMMMKRRRVEEEEEDDVCLLCLYR